LAKPVIIFKNIVVAQYFNLLIRIDVPARSKRPLWMIIRQKHENKTKFGIASPARRRPSRFNIHASRKWPLDGKYRAGKGVSASKHVRPTLLDPILARSQVKVRTRVVARTLPTLPRIATNIHYAFTNAFTNAFTCRSYRFSGCPRYCDFLIEGQRRDARGRNQSFTGG
jgi:hypothetical protein